MILEDQAFTTWVNGGGSAVMSISPAAFDTTRPFTGVPPAAAGALREGPGGGGEELPREGVREGGDHESPRVLAKP